MRREHAMTTTFAVLAVAGLGLLALASTISVVAGQQNAASGTLSIRTMSTDATLVTGGDVLLQVSLPAGAAASSAHVTALGRDVTAAFHAGPAANTLQGVVTGLPVGTSIVEATAGSAHASLTVTNFPITGPVVSGPWQQPFVCQTNDFKLPDGTTLGNPIDENCSARTVVQYIYKSTSSPPPPPIVDVVPPVDTTAATAAPRVPRPWWKPMTDLSQRPEDVATTITMDGVTVPFIVRVETGTMNRGIYQNAILHDPTVEAAPSPFAPPRAWNRRLLAVHGSGCPSGWYIQGAALGVSVLDEVRLSKGYGVFNNTLNHPTNSCNAFLAGETTMMGKEHFIETFGVPLYTISTGGSGGAYTSLQVADAFPGLIDGVDIRATFPDALAIASSGLDAHLLAHYFEGVAATTFTEKQVMAITGYQGMKAFIDAANQSQRTDPVPNRKDSVGYLSARFNAAVSEKLRYDAVTNPHGARPTVFDAARNIYGVNPATGAALRPFDNTGVQYGLAALNSGVITVAQFLELNEGVGGFDQDANYTPARAVGDQGAIKRAYQAGLMLGANGALRSIPILDNATSTETGGYHYGWFHFALRERVRQANGGSSANMVMWRSVAGDRAQQLFDAWMLAYKTDRSSDSQRTKMLRAKPAAAVDGCFDTSTPPQFIQDDLPFTSKPVSKCSELYPVYSAPRIEAGGPLSANIMKCQLKPIDAKDYTVPVSASDRARLKAIFAGGVCDWSKPGVEQTPVVTWASVGPSPKNLIFSVAQPRSSSR